MVCHLSFIQGTELWRCINDSNVVLGRAPGTETVILVSSTLQVRGLLNMNMCFISCELFLHIYMSMPLPLQKVVNRCRTLAALLSCHGGSSTDVRACAQYRMDVLSSARPSSSQARASSACPSSSRAGASSSQARIDEQEDEEEETDYDADPDYVELGASQMEDAPPPIQPSQPSEEARRVSSRTIRHPGWQNTPEGYVNRGKMAAKRGKK